MGPVVQFSIIVIIAVISWGCGVTFQPSPCKIVYLWRLARGISRVKVGLSIFIRVAREDASMLSQGEDQMINLHDNEESNLQKHCPQDRQCGQTLFPLEIADLSRRG